MRSTYAVVPLPHPRRTHPTDRVRDVEVDLVDVVGEADQLPLVVIERDEEVVRVHEPTHDGVHLAVELLHVLCGARELGDPVERRLNPLGAPLAGRGRHVRAFPGRSTDPSIVRDESAVQQPGTGLELYERGLSCGTYNTIEEPPCRWSHWRLWFRLCSSLDLLPLAPVGRASVELTVFPRSVRCSSRTGRSWAATPRLTLKPVCRWVTVYRPG